MSRIPPKAKRVFKGEIFDVYHWPQKMFDGSTETFEMLKRPDTVQIIAVKDGKLLVAKEDQPHLSRALSFLGGRVDKNEPSLAAAKRELLEETGLISRDWELFKVYEPFIKIDWKIYYYIARNCREVQKPQFDGGEKIETRRVDLEEFFRLYTSPKYHGGEFACDLLRMRQDRRRLQEFRKKLQV